MREKKKEKSGEEKWPHDDPSSLFSFSMGNPQNPPTVAA
jgi:hypothetical protein